MLTQSFSTMRWLFVSFLLATVWWVQPATLVEAAILTVTNTNNSGAGSLRNQIAAANPGDTINFNAGLSGQTITLTTGEIIINKNLTFDGSTLASPVTISGNSNGRIFYISESTVSITSLRFVNGDSNDGDSGDNDGDGGAIYLFGNSMLTVDRSEFNNNHAEYNGGAIYLYANAGLTLTNNTFTNNSSLYAGGAVRASNIPNVTISGNTFVDNTANEGGAIWSSATTLVENNTFYSNNGSATVYLYDTLTLTNNTFLGTDGVSIRNAQAFLHMRNNIIGSCYVAGGTISTNTNNWIVNGSCSPAYSGNPYLMPLADNGGPTQTAALLPFSGAVNAANSNCPATDQRGFTRGATCDLGAYEVRLADYGGDQCQSGLVQGQTYGFGATGILITVDTLGNLTSLCVNLDQSNHSNATAGILTGRHWVVTATAGASNWSLTMSAPATITLDSDDKLCRYTGVGQVWHCDMSNLNTPQTGWISRSGITQLSDWAVGNDVGPTAVTNLQTDITPAVGQGWLVALLVGLLGVLTTAVMRFSSAERLRPQP